MTFNKKGDEKIVLQTVSNRRKFSFQNPNDALPQKPNEVASNPSAKRSSLGALEYGIKPHFLKPQLSELEEYDPYDHRQVKHPTSYSETLIHMLKASLGTGILAMPHAFNDAGYAVGTICTILIGLLCTYNIHILVSSEYELCRRKRLPSLNYPETAQAAVMEGPLAIRRIAPFVPVICNIFLLCYQIGSCSIYIVFVAKNIQDVVDEYYKGLDTAIYMYILLVPLILINLLRNLKYLAPLSSIANAVTLVSFVIIFYYLFKSLDNIDGIEPVGTFKGFRLYFGTVLFAMEAIGVVMPLENEMKVPNRFGSTFGVLNAAMIPITLLYTVVGFFGYLQYGSDVNATITLNLPKQELLAKSVKLMLAFAIFISHALACYVAFDILWAQYIQKRVHSRTVMWEHIVRITLVLISFALAISIPHLDLFISLVGALCLSCLGVAFPALIQLFTFWHSYCGRHFALFLVKNLAIVALALFGFIVGTSTSINEIIHSNGD